MQMVYSASEFAGDQREEYEAYLNSLISVWKSSKNQSIAVEADLMLPNSMQQLAVEGCG